MSRSHPFPDNRPGFVPWRAGSHVGYIANDHTGCWDWTGALFVTGYAAVRAEGRTKRAHRVIYEQHHGLVLEALDLDHLCRNRACVNPAHLEAVPRHINAWRGAKSKLTPEIVLEARRLHAAGLTYPAIAQRFGVHHTTVGSAIIGKTWGHVR